MPGPATIKPILPAPAQERHLSADYFGPASYVQGGDTLNASDMGWLAFTMIRLWSIALSGNYQVLALYPGSGQVASVQLQWFDAHSALEVANGVNLSAESVKLEIIGS